MFENFNLICMCLVYNNTSTLQFATNNFWKKKGEKHNIKYVQNDKDIENNMKYMKYITNNTGTDLKIDSAI